MYVNRIAETFDRSYPPLRRTIPSLRSPYSPLTYRQLSARILICILKFIMDSSSSPKERQLAGHPAIEWFCRCRGTERREKEDKYGKRRDERRGKKKEERRVSGIWSNGINVRQHSLQVQEVKAEFARQHKLGGARAAGGPLHVRGQQQKSGEIRSIPAKGGRKVRRTPRTDSKAGGWRVVVGLDERRDVNRGRGRGGWRRRLHRPRIELNRTKKPSTLLTPISPGVRFFARSKHPTLASRPMRPGSRFLSTPSLSFTLSFT